MIHIHIYADNVRVSVSVRDNERYIDGQIDRWIEKKRGEERRGEGEI